MSQGLRLLKAPLGLTNASDEEKNIGAYKIESISKLFFSTQEKNKTEHYEKRKNTLKKFGEKNLAVNCHHYEYLFVHFF